MKNTLFLLVFFFAFCKANNAQDKIYKTDKSVIDCQITEIPDNLVGVVKYKNQNNLTGPTYTIDCGRIYMIQLQSGEKLIPPANSNTDDNTSNDTYQSSNGNRQIPKETQTNMESMTNSGSLIIWAGTELANYGNIIIYCDDQIVGTITKFVANENEVPDCGAFGFASISKTGLHDIQAFDSNGTIIRSWSYGFPPGCHKIRIRTIRGTIDGINNGTIQRVKR